MSELIHVLMQYPKDHPIFDHLFLALQYLALQHTTPQTASELESVFAEQNIPKFLAYLDAHVPGYEIVVRDIIQHYA